ncbi:hypothetical protein GCM10023321_62220 [Pseudonocardia eucalypti]|uniref:Secreted protein n=1 Tax=Pseudonocardia eucalypti TaxID=648755 RepID=A0ABP9QW57_9PSEU|nr:hypothetical protein [Pseudonocardia eucalypti]
MKRVVRIVVVALLATSAAFIPGVAGAAEPETVQNCSANKRDCEVSRSNMARYYRVGPIQYVPPPAPDTTCAGSCSGNYYWFEYWPK